MYKGRVFALEEHIERLINSCRALMFEDIPEPDNIKNAVSLFVPLFVSIFPIFFNIRTFLPGRHQKRRNFSPAPIPPYFLLFSMF